MTDGCRRSLAGELTLDHPLAVALMEVVRERGYEGTTVAEITARAAIDPAEFEQSFAGKEELTTLVMEVGTAELRARVGEAYAAGGEWPASLRAAGWELARWIRENPTAIWFGMVGVLGAEEMTLVRREQLFRWFADLVDAGRAVAPHPESVPAAAATMVVGATVELIRRALEAPVSEVLPTLVPQMMNLAVRPYLGEEAARAELALPPPADFRRDA